jgi:hypothetical protein
MTKEQRIEIESTLCKVFDGFTDERLKGRYYSMMTMSEEEKNDLVNSNIHKYFFPFCGSIFFFMLRLKSISYTLMMMKLWKWLELMMTGQL